MASQLLKALIDEASLTSASSAFHMLVTHLVNCFYSFLKHGGFSVSGDASVFEPEY